MRNILEQRGLRLVFTANLISMIGSGLNSAGVTWFVLQTTHSETALGLMLMLQTIPAMLLLPFSGVVIDRQDRRHLVMLLDALRGLVVLAIAVLALLGKAALWQVYLMSILVAAGFWMFWPTMNALIQELTPESGFAHANSFILAGFQGGWLIAGAVVGFVYNHIGLSGVLFIDFLSYVISFSCYLFVREGKVVVARPASVHHESEVARFFHDMREGIAYIRQRPRLFFLGAAWALFMGGMLTQGIITAPFSDRLLKAGAVGYGWLNSGWAVGACGMALFTPRLLRLTGHRRAIGVAMAVLGCCLISLPYVGTYLHHPFRLFGVLVTAGLMLAVVIYLVMGCGRAYGGVAITSGMMEMVPRHFMGRVQNTFYFAATALQLGLSMLVGSIAHRRGLAPAFAIVGSLYLLACLSGTWPAAATLTPTEEKDLVGQT
ncbi:MAG TPA: MFS transporter [Candidatus Limnocylindrales bacterium]|jgi:MFS family permease|nr:MFS transporter [Candidatus Limnocylindrales bacterium]